MNIYHCGSIFKQTESGETILYIPRALSVTGTNPPQDSPPGQCAIHLLWICDWFGVHRAERMKHLTKLSVVWFKILIFWFFVHGNRSLQDKCCSAGPTFCLCPKSSPPSCKFHRTSKGALLRSLLAVRREKRMQLNRRRKDFWEVTKVRSRRTWRTWNPRKKRSFPLGIGAEGCGRVGKDSGTQEHGRIAKKRLWGWWWILSRLLLPNSTFEGRLALWYHQTNHRWWYWTQHKCEELMGYPEG